MSLSLYVSIFFSLLVLCLGKAATMAGWKNKDKWTRTGRNGEKTSAGRTSRDWRRGCRQRVKREAGWSWRRRNWDERGRYWRSRGSENEVRVPACWHRICCGVTMHLGLDNEDEFYFLWSLDTAREKANRFSCKLSVHIRFIHVCPVLFPEFSVMMRDKREHLEQEVLQYREQVSALQDRLDSVTKVSDFEQY